jgi:type IV pilus assembly protein PilZ
MSKCQAEVVVTNRMIDRSTGAAEVSIHEVARASGAPAASPGEAERRAAPRYDLSLRITLFGDHNFYVGLSENISEGGLFVRTQNLLPIGTRLRLEFTLPTRPTPMTLLGEVRWTRSPNATRDPSDNFGSGSDGGMGIQFKEISPETVAAIAHYISIRKPDFYEE